MALCVQNARDMEGVDALNGTRVTAGDVGDCIRDAMVIIHHRNVEAGWWSGLKTDRSIKKKRNVGEMLCLVHSEVSEALEGHRTNAMDKHLPHRPMIKVELADAVIRILDMAAGLDMDLGGAVAEKMEYNRTRADHQRESRMQ